MGGVINIGDHVKLDDYSNFSDHKSHKDETAVVIDREWKEGRWIIRWSDGDYSSAGDGGIFANLIKVNNPKENNIMTNLVKRAKDLLLSPDDKVLRKQGFTDENGDRTPDGTEVLLDALFKANKATLVQTAKDLEAEDKAKK